ncbi:MAG: hypothetical protein ACI4WX_17130 [Aristaeellaceae bacterium]
MARKTVERNIALFEGGFGFPPDIAIFKKCGILISEGTISRIAKS